MEDTEETKELEKLEERVAVLEERLIEAHRTAEIHRQNSALFRRLSVYQASEIEALEANGGEPSKPEL